MNKHDRLVWELVEAASEVKYKSQRLKDALAALENVRKTAPFSDKKSASRRVTSTRAPTE